MKTILFFINLLLAANFAHAQSLNTPIYNTKGFYVGGSLLGAAWAMDDSNIEAESGSGFGIKIGYNFNTNFGLFVVFDGATIEPKFGEDYALGHFDLGLQGTFATEANRFRPYLRGAIVGMSAQDNNVEINGSGFSMGAGALIFLSNSLSFDVNYTYSWIDVSEVVMGSQSLNVDDKASSARFSLGLVYHF
jgi:hypothetical protein